MTTAPPRFASDSRLQRQWRGWVDLVVGPRPAGPQDLRAHALAQLCLQLPLILGLLLPMHALTLPDAVPGLLLVFPVHLGAMALVRIRHSEAALHTTLAATYGYLVTLTWHAGGLGSAPSWFLPLLPALPLFVDDRRATGVWAAIVLGTSFAFSWVAVSGLPMPTGYAPASATTVTLAAFGAMVTANLLVVAQLVQLGSAARMRLSRLNQKLAAVSESKSAFMATMSHELRTPMNGVIGMAGLLESTKLDAVQADYAATLRTSAEALLHIINDILDFNSTRVSQVTLEPTPVHLPDLARQVLDVFRPTAEQQGLTLMLDADEGLPASVEADPGKLRQVLYHLVSNAVKFTDQGDVTVSLQAVDQPDDRVHVTLAVADTGIGIPAHLTKRVFEEFSQGDATHARRHGGTGLGLAICHGLVTAMGGSIAVDSEVGRGTTVRVELTLDTASAVLDTQEVEALISNRPPDVRVLLVEDNPASQRVGVSMLRRLGCIVDVASDGAEALEMVRKAPYDLVFMDCDLPKVDGFEATRGIRREHRHGRQLPIIALTADGSVACRRKARDAGMTDYLTKPLTLDTLSDVVSAWRDTRNAILA